MKHLKKNPLKEKKMTAREKMLHRAYDPYRQLMQIDIIPGLLLFFACFAISILFFAQDEHPTVPITMWVVFFFSAKQDIYPGICSYFETKYELTKTQELTITKIKTPVPAHGGSFLEFLYDKRLCVQKFKLICVDSNGKKVVLRSIMSRKKYRLLLRTHEDSSMDPYVRYTKVTCSVTYGKYTHIIWWFNSKEEWADKFNHSF